MYLSRTYLLFLYFVVIGFAPKTAFAQTPANPFMVPDVGNKDFHKFCGTDHATQHRMASDPAYAQEISDFKAAIPYLVAQQSQPLGFMPPPPVIHIPVVVHIIHQGEPIGTGINLSEARILAQIDILNEDFIASNTNFTETPAQWQGVIGNPEIQFCMAAIDPNGQPTNGITRDSMDITGTDIFDSNIDSEIKPATWWDSDEYYNIWVVPIPGTTASGGTTGYAYFPTNGVIGSSLDGSVVDYNWFGGPGFGQSGYKTLTHETGHYLGLPHPFDGESCGTDDGFADTPNIDAGTSTYTPNLDCDPGSFPTGPTSCTNEHMYVNYMDYVNDDYCYTSFSNEQIALMRSVLNGTAGGAGFGSRLPLANNATAVCTFYDNDAGVTEILYPPTFLCESGQATPEVVITNFGQNVLTTVTINYQINNNTPVSMVWATNLGTAEKDTVTLAPYTPPVGAYTFTSYTTLPNALADEQTVNDTTGLQTFSINPLPLPLQENFEDPNWDPTINGVFTFNINNDAFEWEYSTDASGFGNGTASALFDNYDGNSSIIGTIDALITPIFDFSTVSGLNLVSTWDIPITILADRC